MNNVIHTTCSTIFLSIIHTFFVILFFIFLRISNLIGYVKRKNCVTSSIVMSNVTNKIFHDVFISYSHIFYYFFLVLLDLMDPEWPHL